MSIATREALGARIRKLRKENNLSQQRLALMTNVERSYLAKLERGERNVSIDCLEKIAQGLDLTLSELLINLDTKPTEDPRRPAIKYAVVRLPQEDPRDTGLLR